MKKTFLLSTIAILATSTSAQAGWRDKCHLEPYKWFQNCTPVVQNHDAPEARNLTRSATQSHQSDAPSTSADAPANTPQSNVADAPSVAANTPDAPSTPSTPNTPDTPNNPDTPDTPDEPTSPGKQKGNNGWGNGDQDAPGNSGPHNNAENNHNGKSDPSHGKNKGGSNK